MKGVIKFCKGNKVLFSRNYFSRTNRAQIIIAVDILDLVDYDNIVLLPEIQERTNKEIFDELIKRRVYKHDKYLAV